MSTLDIIRTEGPIKRSALAQRTGKNLRNLRMEIAEYNTQGIAVIYTNKGYVLSDDRSDVNECAAKMIAAGWSLIKRGAALRKIDVEKVVRELFA